MMIGGRHRGFLAEINVTPFVDVMLVLLIIFMVTAPMMLQGVDVTLPEATAEPIATKTEPLMLSIDSLPDESAALPLVRTLPAKPPPSAWCSPPCCTWCF